MHTNFTAKKPKVYKTKVMIRTKDDEICIRTLEENFDRELTKRLKQGYKPKE